MVFGLAWLCFSFFMTTSLSPSFTALTGTPEQLFNCGRSVRNFRDKVNCLEKANSKFPIHLGSFAAHSRVCTRPTPKA